MAIKVLHIGKYFPPFFGGIESFMAHLLTAISEAGISVSALVHQHIAGFFCPEQKEGFALYRASCFGSLFFAPVSPWFGVELRKVLQREQPTMLHLHMPNTSVFWALLLPSARKLPWIVHWHSDVIGDKPRLAIRLLYPLYRIFERWVLRRAAAIICTSPAYLQSSQPLQQFKHKCVVIPLGLPQLRSGLPSGQFKQTFPVDEQHKPPLRVLVVGRFSYYKGHRYLLDALAQLPENTRTEVVLVGKGELEPELRQQAGSLKLHQVIFAGNVSDEVLQHWYQWCDCICLPSIERTEAFGMVIIEAARQGKPAIVTDVSGSGMSWVVQHNLTGWVVPAADSQVLAVQLKLLSEQSELLQQAGCMAHKRFIADFSIEQVSRQLNQVYEAVFNEKS